MRKKKASRAILDSSDDDSNDSSNEYSAKYNPGKMHEEYRSPRIIEEVKERDRNNPANFIRSKIDLLDH